MELTYVIQFQRILIATDFQPHRDYAWLTAIENGRQTGSGSHPLLLYGKSLGSTAQPEWSLRHGTQRSKSPMV